MGKIIKLDEHLSNMIAAGEVVERPANVVKELIENSIDAGSTVIEIELKGAGLDQIRITDNGSGMDKADAETAFERHATSKIKSEYDLFHIGSLGFRGEALPSIAAVSRMELITSQGNADGYQVTFQAGKKILSGAASARKGTSITVSKLFYNTPARLKYMKGPSAELSAIIELVDKLALAHPEVAFVFANDDKEMLRTSGKGNLLEVLGTIYGYGVAKQMALFQNDHRDYHVSGVIATPLMNRSSKNYITLIANGRVIKNPRLVASVIYAFDQKIPKNRYPIALVKITCDPLLIDVNIHPTKQEIKFSEDAKLSQIVVETLQKAIRKFEMIQDSDSGTFKKAPEEEAVSEQTKMAFSGPFESYEKVNTTLFEDTTIQEPSHGEYKKTEMPSKRREIFPEMEYIGQYSGTYLLFQNDLALYLVDQHAAAERVRYERYIKKMGDPHPAFFDLLVPFNIDFSNHEAILIQNHLAEIEAFGITLTSSGTQSFFINSVPSWFPEGMVEIYAEEVIRMTIGGKNPTASEVRDELAKLLACKQSIKANHFLNQGEVATLIEDLKQCENPYTCPHGRPVMVKLELTDIEKWFKRVM